MFFPVVLQGELQLDAFDAALGETKSTSWNVQVGIPATAECVSR